MGDINLAELSDAELKSLALMEIAKKCQTDLFYLCKNILGYDLMTENTHGDLCDYTQSLLPVKRAEIVVPPTTLVDGAIDTVQKLGHEVEDQFDPRKLFLLLMMPRGTFKSSIVTIGFTLQNLLNDVDIRVLIDSETYSKAKAFFSEIKGHLESNDKYRAVYRAIHGCFPDGPADGRKNKNLLWSDSQLIVHARKRQRKEPTISCCGIDRSINGMHFDLIIGDDLHSELNVTNKDQINKVIQHYRLLLSLLDPGMPLIIIGTRWDYNDLYQYIIDYERHRFNVMIRKAIQDDGSLLFPERLTEDYLREQRISQGPYIFSCQYQNTPVDNETADFKRDNIVRKPLAEIVGRPINWYLSVDPSFYGEHSDYAAFVLAGMDFQRDIYVRHIIRKKMSYGDIINEMFAVYQQFHNPQNFRITRIILETIATQKSIGIDLANEQRRRNMWLPVTEIRSRQKSKEERIRGLVPFYEFGHIYHIKECPQLDELEYELLHFPRGTHDDIIDALATILEHANPPSAKGFDPNQRDEKERKSHKYKPRSRITGV